MNILYIISIISSFLITLLIIPSLSKLAFALKLVDKPNNRKVHEKSIPLIGGIAIFISISLSLGLTISFNMEILQYKNILFSTIILLVMGVIDDRFEMKASIRLLIQLLIAHHIYSHGIKLESLHGLFGINEINDQLQYVLTVIIITGVINAYNLMDGIDGLAAGIALIAFATFFIIALVQNQNTLALVFATNISALLAFLRFNISSSQKIFMGDAGSIMLGFILVVSGLYLLQKDTQTNHQASLQVLAVMTVFIVPVFDALRVFRKRMKAGKSPFHADKTHLHHLLLGLGLKHELATLYTLIIVFLILTIGMIGYCTVGFTLSIISLVILFFMITSLLQFHNELIKWKKEIMKFEERV